MRFSGIRGIHDIPLGSHLCLFYRSANQFLRVTASFVKAGLADHEMCVWILPPPLTTSLALNELLHHGLDGPSLQATKQLQVVSATDWYVNGAFDVDHSLNQLSTLPAVAHQLGFASVRAVGGPGPFLSEKSRQAFMRYEQRVTETVADSPFIGLCCYASSNCVATDMFDIMSAHPRAFLHTPAGWTSI